MKRNERTDEPAAPQPRSAYVRDKWLGENLAFGSVCRVGRRFPSMAPKVAKLVASAAAERDLVDRSDRVFCSPAGCASSRWSTASRSSTSPRPCGGCAT